MSKMTLTITQVGFQYELTKSSFDPLTLESAIFTNSLPTECVVWFDQMETFQRQAIRLDPGGSQEIAFQQPLTNTTYRLFGRLVFTQRLESPPDDIPGLI